MLDVVAARTLLERSRPRCHADGYPPEVRAAVLELAHHELDSGTSLNALSRSIGVNRSTLQYWLSRSAKLTGFVPVVVHHPEEPEVDMDTSPSSLILTSPAGFRIDGLTLDQAIYALRGLN